MRARPHDHSTQPQLWFRRSPRFSARAIAALIEGGQASATPRLGVRDATHPKGYWPGQLVELIVLNDDGSKYWSTTRRITDLHIRKPMHTLTPEDLQHTFFYNNWEDVYKDLEHFEDKGISPDAGATIVEWSM